jgi:hypothetical protein
MVSLRNSETTISTAEAQKEVELAKVEAENERLRDENREMERRNRQSAYYEMINAYRGVYQILGADISDEERDDKTEAFNDRMAGVLLFAAPSVREGAMALGVVFEEIASALEEEERENPEKSSEDCWRDATVDFVDAFVERGSALIPLMHSDVTRGIIEESR